MKLLAATLASLSLIASSSAQADQTKAAPSSKPMLTLEDARMVAPALEKYTQARLLGDVQRSLGGDSKGEATEVRRRRERRRRERRRR